MQNYDMTGLREMIEQMPTDQLDQMLQYELEKRPVDEAAVRLIMEVLEEREQDVPVEMNDRIEAAWAKYQAQIPVRGRSRFFLPGWITRAVAAAAAVVILLVVAVPQDVEAESFWERLNRWTDSIFEFFSPGDAQRIEEYVFETDNPGLQQVYDAVTALGVTKPVVPMWLPEGYELVECKVTETPSKRYVYAIFSNGANTVIVDVAICKTESLRQYSKDESNSETCEMLGVVHHILHNENWWTAVWTKEQLECAIAIDCQEETLYKILKSIYTMEGD